MTETRPRGRPRSEETDRRILGAAWRLMSQVGYARMSMDQVAMEAGFAKPTVYLRYPSKERLAIAAIAAAREQSTGVTTQGETRPDLIAQVRRFQKAAGRPYGMSLIGTVLAEEHETPELLQGFRRDVVGPRRALFGEILGRARERGELREDADLDLAVAALVGAFYAQYLEGRPFAGDWAERLVDMVLAGIRRG
ncbi:MAG: TetR/AcrR family transcriptional regulator [Chloroflexota bacterium]